VKNIKPESRPIIEQINMEAIEEFCRQIYYRDPSTAMHAEHVADLMAGLASQMGMGSDEINLAYMVGVMHDVGKIKTPEAILTKPGRLTPEEFAVMKRHAADGADMLTRVPGAKPIVGIMRHHHERWDGTGYPDGLSNGSIPLFSRMLALCDSFDAMTAARCYRSPVSLKECVREICRCAGSQFDPVVAAVFVEFIRERFGYSMDGA
jgi:putative nucleotidyltransferase with HDIG domain